MAFSKAAALLVVTFGFTKASVVHRVSPELEPASDQKFFKTDYPTDVRAHRGALNFDHPYPAVQDSGDYDRNFVKDENGDQGQWKAQMTYDTLRAKLRKEQKQAEMALKKKEAEMKELEATMAEEKHAEEKAATAKANAAKAKSDADEVARELEELNGRKIARGKGFSESKLDAATAKVQKETADLERCKEELEEAKAKLKRLMEEKEALEKKQAAEAAAAAKLLAEKRAAAQAIADAEAKQAEAARAKEAKLEAQEEELRKEVDREKEERDEAKAQYEAEKSKLEDIKADLESAENKVRVLRGEKVEPVKKSLAVRKSHLLLSLLVVIASAFRH